MLSLKDKAYQVIKLEIIGGNLKPGLFLAEEKLSAKYTYKPRPYP